MAHMKFCYRCGEDVRCREERQAIPDSHKTKLRLTCPNCDHMLATLVDSERELLPVENARIAT